MDGLLGDRHLQPRLGQIEIRLRRARRQRQPGTGEIRRDRPRLLRRRALAGGDAPPDIQLPIQVEQGLERAVLHRAIARIRHLRAVVARREAQLRPAPRPLDARLRPHCLHPRRRGAQIVIVRQRLADQGVQHRVVEAGQPVFRRCHRLRLRRPAGRRRQAVARRPLWRGRASLRGQAQRQGAAQAFSHRRGGKEGAGVARMASIRRKPCPACSASRNLSCISLACVLK